MVDKADFFVGRSPYPLTEIVKLYVRHAYIESYYATSEFELANMAVFSSFGQKVFTDLNTVEFSATRSSSS